MKKAQLGILGVAVLAAGGAGLMAMNLLNRPPEQVIVQAGAPTLNDQVLVASKDIPMGTTVAADMLKWQEWPKSGVSTGFTIQASAPNAMTDMVGSIVRSPIYEGEPIRDNKLVKSEQGFMSAILPKGQRAVATAISTSTGAGGFILPNDRVDVLMTKRRSGEGETGFSTEVILENIRVLAIDQTVQEKDGSSVVVGETATLQLSPTQVEILAVAQQTADRLSLALRSIADLNEPVTNTGDHLLLGGKGNKGVVRVIKYGSVKETTSGSTADGSSEESSGSNPGNPSPAAPPANAPLTGSPR